MISDGHCRLQRWLRTVRMSSLYLFTGLGPVVWLLTYPCGVGKLFLEIGIDGRDHFWELEICRGQIPGGSRSEISKEEAIWEGSDGNKRDRRIAMPTKASWIFGMASHAEWWTYVDGVKPMFNTPFVIRSLEGSCLNTYPFLFDHYEPCMNEGRKRTD